jgi:hypothetical protein
MKFGTDSAVFNDAEHWFYDFGYIYFYSSGCQTASYFDQFVIEVNTSFGSIGGKVSLPDTIVSYSLNCGDTIELGESITISWSGSEADFYYFISDYTYINDSGYNRDYTDSFVNAQSITFDSGFFAYDGQFVIRVIDPINGPVPRPGAVANMSGGGTGFLYCANKLKTVSDTVVIGDGFRPPYKSGMVPADTCDDPDIRMKLARASGLAL